MKLSSLINYRNQLRNLSLQTMTAAVQQSLDQVIYVAGTQPISIGNLLSQLNQNKQDVHGSIQQFQNSLDLLVQEVEQLIDEVEKPYFMQSYKLYENDFFGETIDDLRNRSPNISESTENFYKGRITRYTGWQHPAMIIRPAFENLIQEMVSCDPMYLVDNDKLLLKPAVQRFNEIYQNRLRMYVADERQNGLMMPSLPDAQFGLVVAYNFFNFRPFEVIRRYLEEIYVKLKPGGMLLMTYNDCDRDKAVMLVESNYCCYTPGKLLDQLASTVGFETVFRWNDDGPSTWIELKKPGVLDTLRGGQTLARIVPK